MTQKDNQPVQARANAYRAKMFRAINARKYHIKLAKKFLNQSPPNMEKFNLHVKVLLEFHRLANYNRSKAIELGNIVIQNQDSKKQVIIVSD